MAAGCIAPNAAEPPADASGLLSIDLHWAENAVEAGKGHDHRNGLQHANRSTPNFEVLGWDPLITEHFGRSAGGYFCGSIAERNGKRLAVVHSFVSEVAFVLVDTTDPLKPQKLGELVLPNAHVYDLAITPDQRSVLLATDGGGGEFTASSAPVATPQQAYFVEACTGKRIPLAAPYPGLTYKNGVVLVDISNPMKPEIQDYLYLGGGHSIQVAELSGRILALVTTPAVSLLEVQETQSGRRLAPVALKCMADPDTLATTGLCSYHDGYLQKHPGTGKDLAYLGTSDELLIFDISDLGDPQLVGRWSDWAALGDAAPANPFLHEALPMEQLWDGRHFTFIGEECLSARDNVPSCLALVLDTTNPASPTLVGAWTHPVTIDKTGGGGLTFSLHYLAVVNRTMFVSNYHGGVWAVDVSEFGKNLSLPSIGVFLPDRISPKPVGQRTSFDWAPAVLDVLPQSDGTLVVFDGTSGVYVLRFDASHPAPAPTPWPLGTH